MHNILYTLLAEEDLFNLFEIISKDKPTVAVEYIVKLEKHIELLQKNSELGLECKNKNINKDCRILIYEDYLIF
jgi:plasmid stabilization system protein ParE